MITSGPIKLGRTLRIVRSMRGLEQKVLASRAGLDASYMSLLEADKRTPSMDTLRHICTVLELQVHELMLLAEGHNVESQSKIEELLGMLFSEGDLKISGPRRSAECDG